MAAVWALAVLLIKAIRSRIAAESRVRTARVLVRVVARALVALVSVAAGEEAPQGEEAPVGEEFSAGRADPEVEEVRGDAGVPAVPGRAGRAVAR